MGGRVAVAAEILRSARNDEGRRDFIIGIVLVTVVGSLIAFLLGERTLGDWLAAPSLHIAPLGSNKLARAIAREETRI